MYFLFCFVFVTAAACCYCCCCYCSLLVELLLLEPFYVWEFLKAKYFNNNNIFTEFVINCKREIKEKRNEMKNRNIIKIIDSMAMHNSRIYTFNNLHTSSQHLKERERKELDGK